MKKVFVSSVLLALPFVSGHLWPFAWVGLVPLFFALRNKSRTKAFLLSYLCGIVFWSITIYWLVNVTLLGTLVLVVYLALYFGVFGFFFATMDHGLSAMDYFYLPSLWVVLEYLRSHLLTGFPWALLGYSQCLNLPILQIADITGAWGVSFLVLMCNVAVYQDLAKASRSQRQGVVSPQSLFFVLFILLAVGYGLARLYSIRSTPHLLQRKVVVIQGNISQELKWDPEARDLIVEKYLRLTRAAARREPDIREPNLIIWPEAALPVILEEEPEYFQRVREAIKEIKIPLLLGAVTAKDNLYYNSALLVSAQGEIQERYNKVHLVPFGEYIPLKKALPFLQTIVPIGDITPGKDYTVLEMPSTINHQPSTKFSVLICFEDLFPELSRRFVQRGADMLVNITNDAWYKKSSAPYQHLQASVFRAVENRIPVVRAANTGISGYIAPSGETLFLEYDNGQNIFVEGFAVFDVGFSHGPRTVYNHLGDAFIGACVLLALCGIIPSFRKIKSLIS